MKMKYCILFAFYLFSSNVFAQIEYEKSIKTIFDRTGISLSVPDDFSLKSQKNIKGVCKLAFEKPVDDLHVEYIIWGTRDYMKGLTNKKKKSAKEKKEEETNLFHDNRSYEQTFSLWLMKLNNREFVPLNSVEKNKLNTVYFADWGKITRIFENVNAEEGEGKYNVGFCLHKKDVANVYVFIRGSNRESLYKAVGEIIHKISFEMEIR